MKIVLSLLMLFLYSTATAQEHIHWGSTGNPLNGLTITWQSQQNNDSIRWGYSDKYEQGAFAAVPRDDYSGYLLDFTFPALSDAATLHYSLRSGGVWTEDRTYRTSAGKGAGQITFIAGGDSRTNLADWAKSAGRLAGEKADFHLFLGDHVSSGSSTKDWDNWYALGKDFLSDNLIYHTAGNHEYGKIYLNQFVLPANEKWYSFEAGNAVFICLLTEDPGNQEQLGWLSQTLANAKDKWKILFFHKPFFTTGSHALDMFIYRNSIWKALDDYGADLVLNGHTHYYLRSKPINLNISSSDPVAEYGNKAGQGRLQIVAGSYGAPLEQTGTGWFIEKNLSTLNYCKFTVTDSLMRFSAFDMDGKLIDSISIGRKSNGVSEVSEGGAPAESGLHQNQPNPFRSQTRIDYQIAEGGHVTLKVTDVLGKEVAVLVDQHQQAGKYSVNFDAGTAGIRAGEYYYQLSCGNYTKTMKMIVGK